MSETSIDHGDIATPEKESRTTRVRRMLGRIARGFAEQVVGLGAASGVLKNAILTPRDDPESLDIIRDQFVEQNEPIAPPEPVLASPGVYRSNFSENKIQPEAQPGEMDGIMQDAVLRAKKNLGALPLIHMQDELAPPTEVTPTPVDNEYFERQVPLNKLADKQPAEIVPPPSDMQPARTRGRHESPAQSPRFRRSTANSGPYTPRHSHSSSAPSRHRRTGPRHLKKDSADTAA